MGGPSAQMPYKMVAQELKDLGFEPGWGKDVATIKQTMHELLDLLVSHSFTFLSSFWPSFSVVL